MEEIRYMILEFLLGAVCSGELMNLNSKLEVRIRAHLDVLLLEVVPMEVLLDEVAWSKVVL